MVFVVLTRAGFDAAESRFAPGGRRPLGQRRCLVDRRDRAPAWFRVGPDDVDQSFAC